jgi:hypothetical protein
MPRGAAFADAPGFAAAPPRLPVVTTPDPVDQMPAGDPLVTRSTYRMLLLRGLTPTEAADLTAFMCGIPVGEVHWSLQQVNRLLFLRELARDGRFGAQDGEAPRPH